MLLRAQRLDALCDDIVNRADGRRTPDATGEVAGEHDLCRSVSGRDVGGGFLNLRGAVQCDDAFLPVWVGSFSVTSLSKTSAVTLSATNSLRERIVRFKLRGSAERIRTCASFYRYQPRLCSRGQQSIRSAEREISYWQRVSSCVQMLQISRFAIQGSRNSIQSSRDPIQTATALTDNVVAGRPHSFPGWRREAQTDVRNGAIPGICRHQTSRHSGVGGCSRFRFWLGGFRQRRCRRSCETSKVLVYLHRCATSDFAGAIFTGVRLVPCKRSLQTRSDDGSADGGRDVARSGRTA